MTTNNSVFFNLSSHPEKAMAALDLENNVAGQISVTTGGQNSGALAEGFYAVSSTAAVTIGVSTATGGTTLTATNGYLLPATTPTIVQVRNNSQINAITAASTATLTYIKVG